MAAFALLTAVSAVPGIQEVLNRGFLCIAFLSALLLLSAVSWLPACPSLRPLFLSFIYPPAPWSPQLPVTQGGPWLSAC